MTASSPSWKERLGRPVPSASLAVYRILFGTLMFASTVRFMASDWLRIFYIEPTFHFKYLGFEWVSVLPPAGMWTLYSAIAVSALFITLGLFTRVATVGFLLLFAYAEMIDVTNYLNHYWLVMLLAFLQAFLPMNARWSLDALRDPSIARREVPAWALHLLRFQVAVVYVHAGLAKAGVDWLLHAQPMQLWLRARDETPLLGPLFRLTETAYLFSWAGFLFDSTIVGWLLWKKTRPAAFVAVLLFHGMTQVLFDIGIFPTLMTINATLFLDPDWPSRAWALVRGRDAAPAAPAAAVTAPPGRWALAVLGLYAVFQILVPLRHWLYAGDVLWTEQGMRWSWKVMVREKSGAITYHVRDPKTGRRWQISPSAYLRPRQEFEMSGQPDLVLQLAHRIAADERRRLGRDVEVRAEARVSLNGRPARLMIDPDVDLAKLPDGFAPARWILPASPEPPIRMTSR